MTCDGPPGPRIESLVELGLSARARRVRCCSKRWRAQCGVTWILYLISGGDGGDLYESTPSRIEYARSRSRPIPACVRLALVRARRPVTNRSGGAWLEPLHISPIETAAPRPRSPVRFVSLPRWARPGAPARPATIAAMPAGKCGIRSDSARPATTATADVDPIAIRVKSVRPGRTFPPGSNPVVLNVRDR